MNYIFVDMSYYCFYRYYAIYSWYKRINNINKEDNLLENEIFRNKYDELFIKRMDEMIKKFKIDKFKFYIARDCKRSEIWRHNIYENYKGNRNNNDKNIGNFINHSYNNLIPIMIKKYNGNTLYIDKLEADDCVSIYVNYLKKNNKYDKIYIITNDNDYLQLIDKNIFIYNLKFKLINDRL